MQRLYINGKMLNVVRSFSGGTNKPNIMELADGSFTYLDGIAVFDKNHLAILPRGHKERAMEWFKNKYGEKVSKVEPSNESALVAFDTEEEDTEKVELLPELVREMAAEGL